MCAPKPVYPKASAGAAQLFEPGDDHSQTMLETSVEVVELHTACLVRQRNLVGTNAPGPIFDLVSGIPLTRQRTHGLFLDSETDHVAVHRSPGSYGIGSRKPAGRKRCGHDTGEKIISEKFQPIVASDDLQVKVGEFPLADVAKAWVRPNNGARVVLRV
jgi:hypothetical protein